MQVFEETEKQSLKPLPKERFEAPVWIQAHVHRGDQMFTFDKKRYSLPAIYRGQDVWLRYTAKNKLLRVFSGRRLIREYIVTGKVINYVPEDYPEGKREMMNGGFPGIKGTPSLKIGFVRSWSRLVLGQIYVGALSFAHNRLPADF